MKRNLARWRYLLPLVLWAATYSVPGKLDRGICCDTEAEQTAIGTARSGPDLKFHLQYPTRACGWSNPAV